MDSATFIGGLLLTAGIQITIRALQLDRNGEWSAPSCEEKSCDASDLEAPVDLASLAASLGSGYDEDEDEDEDEGLGVAACAYFTENQSWSSNSLNGSRLGGSFNVSCGVVIHHDAHLSIQPQYSRLLSPVLIVLDLDHTILSVPLSSISVRALAPSQRRALFVDALFFRAFTMLAHYRKHTLAVASFTDVYSGGGYLSCDEAALLFDAALPVERMFLTRREDFVCGGGRRSSEGKNEHIRIIQRREERQRAKQQTRLHQKYLADLARVQGTEWANLSLPQDFARKSASASTSSIQGDAQPPSPSPLRPPHRYDGPCHQTGDTSACVRGSIASASNSKSGALEGSNQSVIEWTSCGETLTPHTTGNLPALSQQCSPLKPDLENGAVAGPLPSPSCTAEPNDAKSFSSSPSIPQLSEESAAAGSIFTRSSHSPLTAENLESQSRQLPNDVSELHSQSTEVGAHAPLSPSSSSPLCPPLHVVLIDDCHTNCQIARQEGYSAFCCGSTGTERHGADGAAGDGVDRYGSAAGLGFSFRWYCTQGQLQYLLGITAEDVARVMAKELKAWSSGERHTA